jgi:hypothetical protein
LASCAEGQELLQGGPPEAFLCLELLDGLEQLGAVVSFRFSPLARPRSCGPVNLAEAPAACLLWTPSLPHSLGATQMPKDPTS